MATDIKETPILYGKDAGRFLNEIAENEKQDHRAEFERVMRAFERLSFQEWKPNALV